MTNAYIQFKVPDGDLSTLAKTIVDAYGQFLATTETMEEYDEAQSYLSERIGQAVEVSFEDFDTDPTYEIARVLDGTDSRYYCMWSSHIDPARKDRYEGGYRIRHDETQPAVSKSFPWKEGEPDFDDRSLRIAGFTDDEIAEINAEFSSVEPTSPTP